MISKFNPFSAIEDAESTTDLQTRAALLESAVKYLALHGDLGLAEVHYAIGYAWYLHPTESTTRDEKIIHHLGEALRISPLHKYARLYLAHYYFDRKQYSTALELLIGFNPTEFCDAGQAWRDAKVAEMILCCRLYLSEIGNIKDTLRRLYESLACLETGMSPEPEELATALLFLVKNQRNVPNPRKAQAR